MWFGSQPTVGDPVKPYRVLSVDGGGMRGVYTAAYLAGLCDAFAAAKGVRGFDIGKGFDLICGTSTGAIVACALAAGISLKDVIKLYRDYGPAIFPIRAPRTLWAIGVQAMTRPKHLKAGDRALRTALEATLGNRTILDIWSDRGIGLSIPAVEMGQQRAWVFKTPHLGGHRDDRYRLVDVCMATSAAPIFRSLAAVDSSDGMGGHQVFADGGLWANNPVLVGLIDALKVAEAGRPIEVFCLGTCPRPEGERIQKDQVHRGLIGWKGGGVVAQVSIAAQEFAFDNMARMLAGVLTDLDRPVKVARFPNGKVPASLLRYLDIDDTSPDAMDTLIDQARADVNSTKSACDDRKNPDGQLISRLIDDMPVAA